MNDLLHSFAESLEKQAVSVGKALQVLKARAAQGAPVSPGLMRTMASDASYGMPLARSQRRAVMNAGADARGLANGTRSAAAMERPTRVSQIAGSPGQMMAAPGGRRLTQMPTGARDTRLPPPPLMPGQGTREFAGLRPAASQQSLRPGLAYAKTQMPAAPGVAS